MSSEVDPDTSATFSTIHTPDFRFQLQRLAEEPPLATQFHQGIGSQMNKNSMYRKLRKPLGICDIEHTFMHIFKKSEFKGKQREVMDAAVGGMDVLVIAPTGMGKSLCFQVPAIAEEHGLTIVITPLVSLMANQVRALENLGINAAMLTSKTPDQEKVAIEKDMKSGHPRIRLLYITPERLAMDRFQNLLKKVHSQNELSRLVIDEAHCISEWGHNFRKEYQQIGRFRELFPSIPIMALTASATKKVQDDIVTSLDMRLDRLYRVVHSFNRVNLFYEVRYTRSDFQEKLNDITSFINGLYKRKQRRDNDLTVEEARSICGIIYCRAKQTCDMVAETLRRKGINAAPFHRGMKDVDSEKNSELWRNAEALARDGKRRVDCIASCNGCIWVGRQLPFYDRQLTLLLVKMGIDIPNCRYIIHYDIPTSFEGYYQETGRAGRDGHASRCLIYYSKDDANYVQSLVKKGPVAPAYGTDAAPQGPTKGATSSLGQLVSMLENPRECRHLAICRYFGEKPKMDIKDSYCRKFCDVCKAPEQTLAGSAKFLPVLTDVDPVGPSIVIDAPASSKAASDGNSEESLPEAGPSRRTIDDSEVGGLGADLPGFAKASTITKKRPREDTQEVLHDRELADSLFSATADQALEDAAAPSFAKKRSPFLIDEEDDSMELDAVQQMDVGDDSMLDEEALLEQDQQMEAPKEVDWKPRRRPSRIEPTQQTGDPANGANSPEALPRALSRSVSDVTALAPKPLSYRRSNGIPDSDDEDEDLPTLPRAPSPKKTTQVRTGPAGVVSIVAPKTGLGTGSHGFQAPFKPTNKPGRCERLTAIDNLPDASQLKFTLVPLQYHKDIPQDLRRQAIQQLYGLLTKAFLHSGGTRAQSEEQDLLDKLKIKKLMSTQQREDIMLYSALEIESDAFWMSITASGFKALIFKYATALIPITKSSLWMSSFPKSDDPILNDLFQGMLRAVQYQKVHVKTQRTATSSSYSEDEDD